MENPPARKLEGPLCTKRETRQRGDLEFAAVCWRIDDPQELDEGFTVGVGRRSSTTWRWGIKTVRSRRKMSTEADAELIELDDDLIPCAACLRIYDDQERRPKFLDCHHSFCSSCIQVSFSSFFYIDNHQNGVGSAYFLILTKTVASDLGIFPAAVCRQCGLAHAILRPSALELSKFITRNWHKKCGKMKKAFPSLWISLVQSFLKNVSSENCRYSWSF